LVLEQGFEIRLTKSEKGFAEMVAYIMNQSLFPRLLFLKLKIMQQKVNNK